MFDWVLNMSLDCFCHSSKRDTRERYLLKYTFFINNQKFKQSPHNKYRLKPFFCIENLREMLNLDLSVQNCALHTPGVPVMNYGDV